MTTKKSSYIWKVRLVQFGEVKLIKNAPNGEKIVRRGVKRVKRGGALRVKRSVSGGQKRWLHHMRH